MSYALLHHRCSLQSDIDVDIERADCFVVADWPRATSHQSTEPPRPPSKIDGGHRPIHDAILSMMVWSTKYDDEDSRGVESSN
jgi:hypothetical protein